MAISKKRIPYGVANYKTLITEYGYYVDKTEYIRLLEEFHSPVFLRPRRFGKSLWCTTLEYYYDRKYAEEFETLFGSTAIGKNSTPHHNAYVVLSLDFSIVPASDQIRQLETNFHQIVNVSLATLVRRYEAIFGEAIPYEDTQSCLVNFARVLDRISQQGEPVLFVIIDEYDNFANQLIMARDDPRYRELTRDDGFLKSFFKLLKKGVKDRTIAHCWVTGVLPITIDELASGYNMAQFLTLNPRFEEMMGFTQTEVHRLLDQVYDDHPLDPQSRPEVETLLQTHYNGYHFSRTEGTKLYNSTILFYFLDQLCQHGRIPKHLTDVNLKTDLSWVRRLTGSNPQLTETFVDQVLWKNGIGYDDTQLIEKFDMHHFFKPSFFPLSFFYLGMLTRYNDFKMQLPNLNMRTIFIEYFNELHQLEVSAGYDGMMEGFLQTQDFSQLFADYWEIYIGQLPETLFSQMSENFYRTTFYEICRRYLSGYFTFHVERSYPGGRSDFEMVGKANTPFAGKYLVVEFKYWSNQKWFKSGQTLDHFKPVPNDLAQLRGYQKALEQEVPGTPITSYLVYCFGNQGFCVVPLP